MPHRHFCLLITLAMLVPVAQAADPSPADAKRLVRLVRQDCGSCHGLTLKGGLGSPLLPATLADKPAESLVAAILHGRPGTAMPPWRGLLTEQEAQWIVERLQAGFPQD
ncbi:cytochrome c [Curvibacter sp. APW13]|uniref:c-type cytochrome n=1 Tax=Curvibacter sp. APW13 TaxID=3077236 RepID=UPI0028E0397E|nr:cytochrome c [Curvibacter sp. APW13]MDT8991540.1 cytochrome c [Curvibacter sp. APW13]